MTATEYNLLILRTQNKISELERELKVNKDNLDFLLAHWEDYLKDIYKER